MKWFVREDGQEQAFGLLNSRRVLIAPDLLVAETLHALRRKLRAGQVEEEQYLRASEDLPRYFEELIPSASVAPEAAALSIRLDHGFYDCIYLATAIASGAEFASADDAFTSKVRAARLPIVLWGSASNV